MVAHLPTLHRRLIPRPRLIQKLDEQRGAFCTVISASAGFGKTTIAAQWLHQSKTLTPIWIPLRSRDSDPWHFTDRILEALLSVPDLRGEIEDLRTLLRIQRISTLVAVAAVLRRTINLKTPLLLALDDAHLADSTECQSILQMLLDGVHESFRLLLITRSMPAATLPTGTLILDTGDLRFTHDEYMDYAQETRIGDLSSADIALLEQRCDGWITALQLLALAPDIRSTSLAMNQSPQGSREYLVEYLDQIVLRSIEGRMRSLLMRCSTIPFITPANAALMTNISNTECAALLESAFRANFFLYPYSDERTAHAFRLHPLFRDFLQRQLRREIGRDEFRILQRNAAEVLAATGDVDDALDLLLQINDVDAATELVARFSRTVLLEFDLITMYSRISRLPPEQVEQYPCLVVNLAMVEVCKGSRNRRQALDRAHRCIARKRTEPNVSNLWQQVTFENEIELVVLEAITSFMEGDSERARRHMQLVPAAPPQMSGLTSGLTHMARAYTPEDPADLTSRIAHISEAAAAFQSIGFTHAYISAKAAQATFLRRAGDSIQTLAAYDRALYESDRQTWTRTETSLDICVDYAETLYWMNQITEARTQLRRVLSSSRDYEKVRYAYLKAELYAAMPAIDAYDYIDAFDPETDRLRWRTITTDHAPSTIGEFCYLRILRDAWRADFHACADTLHMLNLLHRSDDAGAPSLTDDAFAAAAGIHESAHLAAVTYSVLTGHLSDALELRLRSMIEQAHAQVNIPLGIRARTLHALHQFLRRDYDGAMSGLSDLLPIVERSRMPRIMLMHPGVDALLAHSKQPYAAVLLAKYHSTGKQINEFSLTMRESQLLRLLSDGKAPADAAQQLGITTKTARWHIKNACKKLNVNNYRAAVRVYREDVNTE